MNKFKTGLHALQEKTGLSERMIVWSIISVISLIMFTILFTYPVNRKIRMIDEENAQLEVYVQEQIMLEALDHKLNKIIKNTYPKIDKLNSIPYEEERLLELPAAFEDVAAKANVTMVSIAPRSVEDGALVEIDVIFQGELRNLYQLLQDIGRVEYAKRLESLEILALADAEQMKIKFKVPVK